MTDLRLLDRAGTCYARAGLLVEAARCYREAGSFRRAADLWESLGQLREAAQDYGRAGLFDTAAWILAHHLGDVAAARQQLVEADRDGAHTPTGTPPAGVPRAVALRRRLVGARCDVAGRSRPDEVLHVLEDVAGYLAARDPLFDPVVEQRAVAVADAIPRPDLSALLFAASVRGGHQGAADRWDDWSRQHLQVPLVLPSTVPAPHSGQGRTP
jgi:hypothetical protein